MECGIDSACVHIIFFAIFLSLCRKQESMSLRHLPCWHLIPYRRKTCYLNQDTANGPTCEKYKEANPGRRVRRRRGRRLNYVLNPERNLPRRRYLRRRRRAAATACPVPVSHEDDCEKREEAGRITLRPSEQAARNIRKSLKAVKEVNHYHCMYCTTVYLIWTSRSGKKSS